MQKYMIIKKNKFILYILIVFALLFLLHLVCTLSVNKNKYEYNILSIVIGGIGKEKIDITNLVYKKIPFTFSIKPFMAYTRYFDKIIHETGNEIIVETPYTQNFKQLNRMNNYEIASYYNDCFMSVSHAAGAFMKFDPEPDNGIIVNNLLRVLDIENAYFLTNRQFHTFSNNENQFYNPSFIKKTDIIINMDSLQKKHLEKQIRKSVKIARQNGVSIIVINIENSSQQIIDSINNIITDNTDNIKFVPLSGLIVK